MLERFTEADNLNRRRGKLCITPENIDQIVQDILEDMPLKEKAIIANLDEDKVPYLQYDFDVCIRGQTWKG